MTKDDDIHITMLVKHIGKHYEIVSPIFIKKDTYMFGIRDINEDGQILKREFVKIIETIFSVRQELIDMALLILVEDKVLMNKRQRLSMNV